MTFTAALGAATSLDSSLARLAMRTVPSCEPTARMLDVVGLNCALVHGFLKPLRV